MQMQQIRPITLAPAQEVEFIYTSPKASKQHPKQGGHQQALLAILTLFSATKHNNYLDSENSRGMHIQTPMINLSHHRGYNKFQSP
jgi:hypothetical protein